MTPAERAFWMKANRRVSGLTPEMNAALLRAFAIIRDSFSEIEIARIVATGNVEEVIRVALSEAILDRAFIPVRQRIRQTTERGFKYATADLPKKGKIDGVVAVTFDHLSPNVVDAIRSLESDAINTLKGEVKEVTRAFLENGSAGRPATTERVASAAQSDRPGAESGGRGSELRAPPPLRRSRSADPGAPRQALRRDAAARRSASTAAD
jgi:hypothetical protein